MPATHVQDDRVAHGPSPGKCARLERTSLRCVGAARHTLGVNSTVRQQSGPPEFAKPIYLAITGCIHA